MTRTTGYDPAYETTRVADAAAFLKKMRVKGRLFRLVGEIYIGKCAKLAYFKRWLKQLKLSWGANILEVGSGDGLFSFYAASHLPQTNVRGLELNAIEASVCDQIARQEKFQNLNFQAGTLSDLAETDFFDLIFCLDVLEHIANDVPVMAEMAQVLKPGGFALIHVPHRTHKDFNGLVHIIPDEEAWEINPGHVRQGYTVDELRGKLESAGLLVKQYMRTQGADIGRAHALYARHEHSLIRRVLLLPIMDHYIRRDLKAEKPEGNTLWMLAQRPA